MEKDTEKNEGNKIIIATTEKSRRNKILMFTVISLCTVLVIYFGIAEYFRSHFYFGSEINCVSVSGKTVGGANKKMASQMKSYKLNLKERDGKNEQIRAEDIGLKYNSGGKFNKLKDKQHSYKWILALASSKDTKLNAGVSYDKKQLEAKLDNLSCFDSKNVIEPKNPSFKYSDKGYTIGAELNGNKVDKNALYDNVVKAILKGENKIDLQAIKCYVNPEYTVKSNETTKIRDSLNQYVSSKITYTFGDNKETIDGSAINEWLTVNDNFKITFDEKKMKKYMDVLSSKINTYGKTRSFVTSSGRTINIGGGDYGWQINTAKETEDLIAAVKDGKTIDKEPKYIQTAASHSANDIGNTYVEIDMAKQHLWFYKNGSLIVQGDVVTGNVSEGRGTPTGIYRLKYKLKNYTLVGEDYKVPVSFWMPFNAGIGLHDASWRKGEFGGTIYRTDGSHGCVNLPYAVAKPIYENISEGAPIVCYN